MTAPEITQAIAALERSREYIDMHAPSAPGWASTKDADVVLAQMDVALAALKQWAERPSVADDEAEASMVHDLGFNAGMAITEARFAALNDTLALVRDRAKATSAERWIEDSAAIHSLAHCVLAESPAVQRVSEVEVVARAIAKADEYDFDKLSEIEADIGKEENESYRCQDDFRKMARAAIEAGTAAPPADEPRRHRCGAVIPRMQAQPKEAIGLNLVGGLNDTKLPTPGPDAVARAHHIQEITWDVIHKIASRAEAERHNLGMVGYVKDFGQPLIAAAITRAVEEEREACAKIAERMPSTILHMWERPGGPPGNGYAPLTGKDVAAHIRARAPTKETGE